MTTGYVDTWSTIPLRPTSTVAAESAAASIISTAMSSNGRHALTADSNGRSLLLDYQRSTVVEHGLTPGGNEYQRTTVLFSSDGQFAVVAPAENGIGVWQTSDAKFVSSFNPFPGKESFEQ
jgi:hypothetical protein